MYYVALNGIVFLPLVIFFTWSYIRIAMVVWQHQTPGRNESKGFDKKKTIHNHHFERKVRTFKIVIILLLSFILCRLPYWIFYIIRLSNNTSNIMWIIHFLLISLSILNCALNPLLYNFLNESITIFKLLSNFIMNLLSIFCCFINDEFDKMSKYNLFGMNNSKDIMNDDLKTRNEGSRKKHVYTSTFHISRNY